MIKKLLKVVSILIAISLIMAIIFFYSIFVAVDHVKLVYSTISDEYIPQSLNNINIAFISDIKYNEFMDETRLTKMITKLSNANPDIVIFGGDIFSNASSNFPDSEKVTEVTDILKSIKAPLGKFAVLGDEDLVNDDVKKMVTAVLTNSDFELITNKSLTIRNEQNEGITLIGLDSMINGSPSSEKAFHTLSNEQFNILVTHCPDVISSEDINTEYLDVILSAHSLGGQIYLPLIGPIYRMEGAKKYTHGMYNINGCKLIISNGLGTTNLDMRLFSPPQIHIIHLESSQ